MSLRYREKATAEGSPKNRPSTGISKRRHAHESPGKDSMLHEYPNGQLLMWAAHSGSKYYLPGAQPATGKERRRIYSLHDERAAATAKEKKRDKSEERFNDIVRELYKSPKKKHSRSPHHRARHDSRSRSRRRSISRSRGDGRSKPFIEVSPTQIT